MIAFDTNVLLYVHDAKNPEKARAAAALIRESVDGVLLWQVVVEYLGAARKYGQFGMTLNSASRDVDDLAEAWTIRVPTPAVRTSAVSLCAQYSLSIWDALIVAAAAEANVDTLYSEDLGTMAYKRIAGVALVNPFAAR
jgi:predicted nucleic acid-binding protein